MHKYEAKKTVTTRGGGSRFKLAGPGDPEGYPDYLAYVFLSSLVVSLFVDLQFNPFMPSPSHPATESPSFRFISKIFFFRYILAGGKERKFFTEARTCSRQP